MADETVVVEEKFEVNDDEATRKLGNIEHAGHRLIENFTRVREKLFHVAEAAGLIGGAFAVPEMIRRGNEFLRTVSDISTITGLSARHASGLMEAFEGAGIEAGQAENILLMLSRTGARMQMMMQMGGRTAGMYGDQLARLGVDIQKGPADAMVQLAKRAQEGKLSVQDLLVTMGVRGTQARDLMELLKKGPGEIQRAMARGPIGTADLAQYEKARNLGLEVSSQFTSVLAQLEVRLLPLVSKFLEYVKTHMEEWGERLKDSFNWISKNIGTIESVVKWIGYGLATAFAVEKFAGFMGMINQAAGVLNGIKGMGGAAGLLGSAGEALGLTAPAGEAAAALGGIGVTAAGAVAAIAAFAGAAAFAANEIYTKYAEAQERPEGRMATAINAAAINKAVTGAEETAQRFGTHAADMETAMERLGTKLTPALAKAGMTLDAGAGAGIVLGVTGMKATPEEIARASGRALGMWKSGLAAAKAQAVTDLLAPEDKDKIPQVNMDFSGSHIEINQQFAEGFDPDRIAVSLTNSLANLGERPRQSPFAPPFTVR